MDKSIQIGINMALEKMPQGTKIFTSEKDGQIILYVFEPGGAISDSLIAGGNRYQIKLTRQSTFYDIKMLIINSHLAYWAYQREKMRVVVKNF